MRVHTDLLPSGLTVVTVEVPHLHTAMCAVYVRVGSRHETPKNNGVTHMLEHLFFRGTARWPDSVHMNAAVEAVGGNLNGVTTRDSSTFYTPVHPDGVEVALAILGDMLTRPQLIGAGDREAGDPRGDARRGRREGAATSTSTTSPSGCSTASTRWR